MNGKLIFVDNDGNEFGSFEEIMDKLFSQKPPLGAAPKWIAIPSCITELSEAITRSAESGRMDVEAVREWAHEIMCHCDTLDELQC